MGKKEYLGCEGFRTDGRKPNEIRFFRCSVSSVGSDADGSATVECGNTKILAYVYGPAEGTRFGRGSPDVATIHCEVFFAPFCAPDQTYRSKNDKNAITACDAIKTTMESSVLLTQYPKSTIAIFVHVIELDGGLLSTCLNAATLAMVDAGVSMRYLTVSCGSLLMDRSVLADPNSEELQSRGPELVTCVPAGSDKVCLFMLDEKTDADMLQALFDASLEGCATISVIMQHTLRDRAATLADRVLTKIEEDDDLEERSNETS